MVGLGQNLIEVLCERLGDRFGESPFVRLAETLGEGLSERLLERQVERFGEMLCKRLDQNIIQVYFRQGSSRIQESLNLLQLPSPDVGLVFRADNQDYQRCVSVSRFG